jgi:ABC-type nitrate/sulfonate/bicarbonate transport system ATPase subunit
LLDEPLSAVDLPGRAALLQRLQALLPGLGIPTLWVTHSREEQQFFAELGAAVYELSSDHARRKAAVAAQRAEDQGRVKQRAGEQPGHATPAHASAQRRHQQRAQEAQEGEGQRGKGDAAGQRNRLGGPGARASK